MVIVVIVFNLALALMLMYGAWSVWQLRSQLAQLADALSNYERSIYAGLSGAPKAISTTQISIRQLRQRSLLEDLQLLRIQQILTLLGVGEQIWQRSRLVRRSRFLQKALAKSKFYR